jgi:hypothetical protein
MGKTMQLASQNKTCETLDSLVRMWLVALGEAYQYVVSPTLAGVWISSLEDVPVNRLDAAFKALVKKWKPDFGRRFPVPADLLSVLDKADDTGFELKAQREWDGLLIWIQNHYFPDSGVRRGAPHLSPAVQHAARAAGGFAFIERCSESELVWCRKTFLAAYKNYHETAKVDHLLSDGEAKEIYARLTSELRPVAAILKP